MPSLARISAPLLAASLALVATDATAAPFVIDDFSTSQPTLSVAVPNTGSNASSSVTNAGILGNERDVVVTLTSGTNGSISGGVSGGVLTHTQQATTRGNTLLVWDGADNAAAVNATGLGGLDLTSGGTADAFLVTVASTGAESGTLATRVYSGNSAISERNVGIPANIATPTVFRIPFSQLTNITMTQTPNFASVGAVSMSFGSVALSPTIVVDRIETTGTVAATLTVAHLEDLDGDGVVEPGDSLRFTAVIRDLPDVANQGSNGITFTIGSFSECVFMPGSVMASQGLINSGNNPGDTSASVSFSLLSEATATITVDARVNDAVGSGGIVSAQGQLSKPGLSGVLTDDPSTPEPFDATTIMVTGSSVIRGSMTVALGEDADDNGVVTPGDTLDYTAVITNTGNVTSDAIGFSLTPSAIMSLVVGSVATTAGTVTTGNTAGDATVEVAIGAMAGATTQTVTFSLRVNTTSATPWPARVSAQGRVTGGMPPVMSTDNPSTPAMRDPTTIPLFFCGDTVTTAPETCDDGNTTSGDGCSSTCTDDAPPEDAGVDAAVDAGGGGGSGGGCAVDSHDEGAPTSALLLVCAALIAMRRRRA